MDVINVATGPRAERRGRRFARLAASAGAALLLGLCLTGCEPDLTGPLSDNNGGVPTTTLPPVPRGATTPEFIVDLGHPCRLESPAPTEGTGISHPGTALITFKRLEVELEMTAGRARLRCLRPKTATDLDPLSVCSFSGEPLGLLDIDQEISVEGFLGNRARVQFDLSAGLSGGPPKPRLLLDPLPTVRVLNHSTHPILWTNAEGRSVAVNPQERAELQLGESLDSLQRARVTAADLTSGRLYAAHSRALTKDKDKPKADFYIARGKDDRLLLMSDNLDAEFRLPFGTQTDLVLHAPGGAVEIRGAWHLDYTPGGEWILQPDIAWNDAFPVLANISSQPVTLRNRMSATDSDLPAHTWRLLKPLP